MVSQIGAPHICAAVLPNYAAATAGVMIGFAEEIEAWVQDHAALS